MLKIVAVKTVNDYEKKRCINNDNIAPWYEIIKADSYDNVLEGF